MNSTKLAGLLAMIFTSAIVAANADYYNQNQSSNGYNTRNNVSNNSNHRRAQMPDTELARQIQDKMASGWFAKAYAGVTARVRNGDVELQGQVKTWEDKSKLENEIRNMKGVNSLNSQITVLEENPMEETDQTTNNRAKSEFPQDKGATALDEELNKKIRESISLGWLWNSYKEIVLNTKNGVVTLEGTIKDPSNQKKLVAEIQKIDGVKSVKNKLHISNSK